MANPISSGFRKWVGFNVAHENPILAEDEEKGGFNPPQANFLITEDGDPIITEDGDNLITET